MSIKEYKLGEILFITKLAGFEYSKYISPNKNLKNSTIKLVQCNNIKNNRLDLENSDLIPKKVSDFLRRSKPIKYDVLFSYVGTVGETFFLAENLDIHLGSNVAILRVVKNDVCIQKYLYLLLNSKMFKNKISQNIKGTTQKNLSMSDLRSIRIPLPNLKTQQSIIDIIEPFEKILNIENKKIIHTNLLLTNIYNKLKKDEKISFLEMCEFCGSPFNNQNKYVDTSNISTSIFKSCDSVDLKRKSRANLTPCNNSIIFSKLKGENKLYPIFDKEGEEFVFSTGFQNIRSQYSAFIYGFLLTKEFIELKNNTCSGSVMQGINKNIIKSWEINKINTNLWNDKFDKILRIICLTNKMIKLINKIIENLIDLYII